MKNFLLFLCVGLSASCGSSKKATEAPITNSDEQKQYSLSYSDVMEFTRGVLGKFKIDAMNNIFTMATRAPTDPAVIPHSEADRATFSAGLEVFLTEAGTLARFSHPNIARVREFFTENSTGYCVMDDYDGQSLPEYLQRTGALLSPGLA